MGRPERSDFSHAAGRIEGWLVVLAFAVATALLVVVATRGSTLLLIGAVGVAACTLVLGILGSERTGTLFLMAAFGTAPMYKGLAPSPESLITPTDLLFVAGFGLLAPTLLDRRLKLPLPYVIGILLVIVTGCIGSLVSEDSTSAFFSLALWLVVMGGIPTLVALWRPHHTVIALLLWSYVAGHMVSTADALRDGAIVQGRYAGLTTHFNLFGQAGLLSFAILLYLFSRCRTNWGRLVVLAPAVVSVYTVHMSGSRAATLVVAVLVLMIPIVERSAIIGFVWGLGGALVVIAIPLIVDVAGENSALGRLTGGGGSQYSNQERAMGRDMGISRFLEHPITGSGLVDLFRIHNNYIEVAVGVGVFGLVGYLLILFVLARPLFGDHPDRRLAYAVWAYIGFGATIPSLYDRGIWAPVSLAMLAALTPVADQIRERSGDALPPTPDRAPDGEPIR